MKVFLYLLLLPLLVNLGTHPIDQPEAQPSNWKSGIDSLMNLQEKAWNSGDLEGFMQSYHQSDSLIFVGSRGLTYGWKNTLDNYRKSYPDKKQMGTLHFENDEYRSLSETNALVVGRWHLYRATDTLQGSYSLNWQLIEGQWKIIADHSS